MVDNKVGWRSHLQSKLDKNNRTDVVSGHVTLDQHVFCVYSLCIAEGHLKVLPAVAGAQGVVVEGFREKIVHQGAKCHAITPAGGEILNIHMLREKTNRTDMEAVIDERWKHLQKLYYLNPSCLQVQLQLHWLTLRMHIKHTVGCRGCLAHLI